MQDIISTLAGVGVGFLLARGWDWWTERKRADAICGMMSSEIAVNLRGLREWLDMVNKGDYSETFPS
jgi:hypothetical protein